MSIVPREQLKLTVSSPVHSYGSHHKTCLSAAVFLTSTDADRPRRTQRLQTTVDRDGGENPEWDQPMRFDVDGDDLILEFELKDHGGLLPGDKIVGRASVPVTDLAAERLPGAFGRVSYRVLAPDGKPNGVLSFAYRIDGRGANIAPPPPDFLPSAPVLGYMPPPDPPAIPPPLVYCSPPGSHSMYPPPVPTATGPSPMYPPLPLEPAWSMHPPPPPSESIWSPCAPPPPGANRSMYPPPPPRPEPNWLLFHPAAEPAISYPAPSPLEAPTYPPPPGPAVTGYADCDQRQVAYGWVTDGWHPGGVYDR
ncbi:hypothetical protein BHM03_00038222 [Ensete ventricosum]|nr:hypothetical protein BHM03_00038222 [Ensete ventricosum]